MVNYKLKIRRVKDNKVIFEQVITFPIAFGIIPIPKLGVDVLIEKEKK